GEDRGYRGGGGDDHGNRDGGEGRGKGSGGWKHQEQQVYQPQVQPRQVWQQQMPQVVYQGRGNGNGHGNGNGRWNRGDENRQETRRSEGRVYNIPQQSQWGGGFVPPGQIRSQQVHERNAERKASKDQEKAYRKGGYNSYGYDPRQSSNQWLDRGRQMFQSVIPYANNSSGYVPNSGYRQYRSYGRNASDAYRYSAPASRSYDPGYYGYGQNYGTAPYNQNYGYDPYGQSRYGNDPDGYGFGGGQGTSWKQQILRTFIRSVLGGGLGGNRGSASSYDPYYSNNYSNYSRGPAQYVYAKPNYYGGYAPQYAGYGQSLLPYANYGRQSDSGDPYGGYADSYSGGLLNSLPIGSLFGQSGSGSFVTQMLSGVIANGYLQGLINGGSARRSGLGEDAYYDPYVSDAGVYDPYSYSIGENRRLMSEGYDLGYEDAFAGRNQYDPNAVQNVDLVSLLLGNVLNIG
ncbi:MAG: hypothetical protein ACR2IH_08520, partial [Pyrinomonadaceae bacterium]